MFGLTFFKIENISWIVFKSNKSIMKILKQFFNTYLYLYKNCTKYINIIKKEYVTNEKNKLKIYVHKLSTFICNKGYSQL